MFRSSTSVASLIRATPRLTKSSGIATVRKAVHSCKSGTLVGPICCTARSQSWQRWLFRGVRRMKTQHADPVSPSLWKRWEFPIAVGIGAVKTSMADLVTQILVEGKDIEQVDWRRNAIFCSFGFWYLGIAMFGVYVHGFRRVFSGIDAFAAKSFRDKLRDRRGMTVLTQQVFADIFVIQVFMYWPVFHLMKAVGFREPSDERGIGEVLWGALVGYGDTWIEDNFGMAAFWIPANYVIYAAPLHFRMPLTHVGSLFWCMILSFWKGTNTTIADEHTPENSLDYKS